MKEAFLQSLQNLRANKLRSCLTMFGILWGMVSVVILSAMGEAFQQGNDKVLLELGKNIGTSGADAPACRPAVNGPERQISLTLDDARALQAESAMVAVVSPSCSEAGFV